MTDITMKQNDAVVAAVTAITGYNPETGACKLTKEQKAQVRLVLYEGFINGRISLAREPYATEAEWMSYISGLIDNHMRKDKRLNGGVKYETKNPGSRAHHSDDQLKALFGLYQVATTEQDKTEIMGYISARKAELNKAKVQPTINFDALPDALKAKFGPQ